MAKKRKRNEDEEDEEYNPEQDQYESDESNSDSDIEIIKPKIKKIQKTIKRPKKRRKIETQKEDTIDYVLKEKELLEVYGSLDWKIGLEIKATLRKFKNKDYNGVECSRSLLVRGNTFFHDLSIFFATAFEFASSGSKDYSFTFEKDENKLKIGLIGRSRKNRKCLNGKKLRLICNLSQQDIDNYSDFLELTYGNNTFDLSLEAVYTNQTAKETLPRLVDSSSSMVPGRSTNFSAQRINLKLIKGNQRCCANANKKKKQGRRGLFFYWNSSIRGKQCVVGNEQTI